MTAGKLDYSSCPRCPLVAIGCEAGLRPLACLAHPTGPRFPVGAPDTTAHSPISLWIVSDLNSIFTQ